MHLSSYLVLIVFLTCVFIGYLIYTNQIELLTDNEVNSPSTEKEGGDESPVCETSPTAPLSDNLDQHQSVSCGYLPPEPKPPIKLTEAEIKLLKSVQHRAFRKTNAPLVFEVDGELVYWDDRYPEQPIPLEFLKSPSKYCLKYPGRYPCYKIAICE